LHAAGILGFFMSYLVPSLQSVFFERMEVFVVRTWLVRGPEFGLSVRIPRQHQQLYGSGRCLFPGSDGMVSFSSLYYDREIG
jgi:hypothetical protein